MAKKYYAVKKGYHPGIYTTWPAAQKEINGFSGAQFKSFPTKEEAEMYLNPPAEKPVDILDDSTIEAYVDGSFDKHQQKYSYGVAIIKNGNVVETFAAADNDSRYVESYQIAGEVFGSLNAIKWAKRNGYKTILIHYDYLGIEHWAKGVWKANKAVSKDYVEHYKTISQGIEVRFKKEKAHTGVKYNELADQLAKEALRSA